MQTPLPLASSTQAVSLRTAAFEERGGDLQTPVDLLTQKLHELSVSRLQVEQKASHDTMELIRRFHRLHNVKEGPNECQETLGFLKLEIEKTARARECAVEAPLAPPMSAISSMFCHSLERLLQSCIDLLSKGVKADPLRSQAVCHELEQMKLSSVEFATAENMTSLLLRAAGLKSRLIQTLLTLDPRDLEALFVSFEETLHAHNKPKTLSDRLFSTTPALARATLLHESPEKDFFQAQLSVRLIDSEEFPQALACVRDISTLVQVRDEVALKLFRSMVQAREYSLAVQAAEAISPSNTKRGEAIAQLVYHMAVHVHDFEKALELSAMMHDDLLAKSFQRIAYSLAFSGNFTKAVQCALQIPVQHARFETFFEITRRLRAHVAVDESSSVLHELQEVLEHFPETESIPLKSYAQKVLMKAACSKGDFPLAVSVASSIQNGRFRKRCSEILMNALIEHRIIDRSIQEGKYPPFLEFASQKSEPRERDFLFEAAVYEMIKHHHFACALETAEKIAESAVKQMALRALVDGLKTSGNFEDILALSGRIPSPLFQEEFHTIRRVREFLENGQYDEAQALVSSLSSDEEKKPLILYVDNAIDSCVQLLAHKGQFDEALYLSSKIKTEKKQREARRFLVQKMVEEAQFEKVLDLVRNTREKGVQDTLIQLVLRECMNHHHFDFAVSLADLYSDDGQSDQLQKAYLMITKEAFTRMALPQALEWVELLSEKVIAIKQDPHALKGIIFSLVESRYFDIAQRALARHTQDFQAVLPLLSYVTEKSGPFIDARLEELQTAIRGLRSTLSDIESFVSGDREIRALQSVQRHKLSVSDNPSSDEILGLLKLKLSQSEAEAQIESDIRNMPTDQAEAILQSIYEPLVRQNCFAVYALHKAWRREMGVALRCLREIPVEPSKSVRYCQKDVLEIISGPPFIFPSQSL